MGILDYSDRNKGITENGSGWGDSLMAGAGGTAITTHLQNRFRRIFNNYGIGGQTSIQIAARAGGQPVYITTSVPFSQGNAIPCTLNINLLSTGSDNNTRTISGVIGIDNFFLQRTATGTSPNQVESYTITPQQNTTASALNAALFEPDDSFNSLDDINLFALGRNDPDKTQLLSWVKSCILKMNKPRRALVGGVLNATYEPIGSSAYNSIKAYNDTARAEFGDHFVEYGIPSLAELAAIGYTVGADDLTALNLGIWPLGLRNDEIHLNTLGYLILANRYADKIIKFGW